MKANVLDRARRRHAVIRNSYKDLLSKPDGESQLGRASYGADNLKTGLRQTMYEGMNWKECLIRVKQRPFKTSYAIFHKRQ